MNERCTDMNNARSDERLEMRWLPVADAHGRTRMEATWVAVSTSPVSVPVAHAA